MVRLPLLVMLVALFLMWGHADRERALAQGAGMSLVAPTMVSTGEVFNVIVMADPAPAGEIGAFASEVLFPGLEWLQRESCGDEVQVGRQDGELLVACIAIVTERLGGAATTVLSEVVQPPIEPLTLVPGSTAPLVELDFRCTAAGSYTLTLTAAPDSPIGALYVDLDANNIFVETEPYDYDGDTLPNDVADSVTIDCQGPPVPTTVVTPRLTATPPMFGTETPRAIEPSPTDVNGSDGNNGDDDDGIGAGLWAVIAAVLAAAVAGLVVFGWRYARSR